MTFCSVRRRCRTLDCKIWTYLGEADGEFLGDMDWLVPLSPWQMKVVYIGIPGSPKISKSWWGRLHPGQGDNPGYGHLSKKPKLRMYNAHVTRKKKTLSMYKYIYIPIYLIMFVFIIMYVYYYHYQLAIIITIL